jgi:hypothetical protein
MILEVRLEFFLLMRLLLILDLFGGSAGSRGSRLEYGDGRGECRPDASAVPKGLL